MAMSRRKQLHPKSLKDGDETIFVLPDELKCDEESHEIIARLDIKQGHRFGPFPVVALPYQSARLSSDSDTTNCGSRAIVQIGQATIEQQIPSFQLLDNKQNWLVRCSMSDHLPANLDVMVEDEHIFAIVTESIPVGTRLCSNINIYPKINPMEDSLLKSDGKLNLSNISTTSETLKVKEEPVESEEQQPDSSVATIKSDSSSTSNNPSKSKETKKLYPLLFTCEDCGIRFSNRGTLDAHRSHYCTKRDPIPSIITATATKSHSADSTMSSKIKSMKRKHLDITESSSSPNKRLSLSSNDTYCSDCDILFSKSENYLQHKLYYCGTKSSSSSTRQLIEQNLPNSFRPPMPFDRPIQIGQFIYVPVPIVPSAIDHTDPSLSPPAQHTDNKPLDLSKPKHVNDNCEQTRPQSTSPLDLTMEKSATLFHLLNTSTSKTTNIVPPQIYECDYCSIRFSSLKTLNAHQENYCIEYRKQKKNISINLIANTSTNEPKSTSINEKNRSQSPPSTNVFKSVSISPINCPTSSSVLPHRSSPFMCRLCKYRGNTLRGMRMHFKFHLSNNEVCSDDDIIVTSTLTHSSALVSSTSVASQFLLKCLICSAMFDHEETLFNHMKCVHTKSSQLECLECQSRFCSKWNLLRHMKLTHTNIKCDDNDDDDDDVEQQEDDKEEQEQEQEQQQRRQDDEDEQQLNTKESQLINNGSNCNEKLDDNQDLSSCDDKSSDPVNLTRHILIESIDMNSSKKLSTGFVTKKKFACPYCHIKFGSIETLKQHMTNYCSSRPTTDDVSPPAKKKSVNHSATDTYCSSCQIPFRQKSSYEAHKMYYCRASQKAHVKIQV